MYPKEESPRIGTEIIMYDGKGIFSAPKIALVKIKGIPGVSLRIKLQTKKLILWPFSGIKIGFLRIKPINLLMTFIPNILAIQ